MKTGVIFNEFEQPYVYEDLVLHNFYVVTAKPRVRKYVVRDHSFQHPLTSPLFDLDAPYAFSLSWLHSDSVHHPFDHLHGGPGPIHQDDQIVLEPGPIVDDYIPESPPSTPEVIVIPDDEDIKKIEIVDLTSDDDDDPKMDTKIMDLTSDSD
ncbi:hypothetical protein AHAS_Ahas19G0247600 [Arachis hypogaea]